MDSFDGIIEFVAVAELQGFAPAAKRLGCSTSHVSRQISRLEERLGSVLFARTTRQVSLTSNGRAYYQQCKDLVTGLEQANEQVRKQQFQLKGTLRVSAAGTFAEKFVAPVLMEFALRHPGLSIEMDFNSRNVNFVEEDIDFAIRYGQLADSTLIARKLVDRPLIAVASKAYIEQFGAPSHPENLKYHSCIISNNDHWTFQENNKSLNVKVSGRWRCNNAHAVVKSCEKGLGIAYMPKSNFTELLEAGALLPVLEPFWSKGTGSWIVYQNRQFLPTRARMAIDHLLSHFSVWKE
ncbi:MAG: LysR family transcriptional regulator [Aestuariibacter sp.]